jgi:type I restriction enzyme S subunit
MYWFRRRVPEKIQARVGCKLFTRISCNFLGRGISPTYDDEGEYRVVSQKCVRNRLFSLAPARRQTKEFQAEKELKYLDVLINSTGTGTLGRVAQCWLGPEATTFDSHVSVARANSVVYPVWFGYAMTELETLFEGMGEGATNQKELSKGRIAEVRMVVPPRQFQSLFSELAMNTTSQIQTLGNQNQKLGQARDLLLPRLMNGEIAV